MGLISWIKNLNGNTLYYPGCLTKGVLKQEFENYKDIFNRLNIDFILLPEEVCCGSPVINAGYKKDARELAEKNFKLFKERSVKKIITNCPACYHVFKEIYPKFVRGWDIKVEHATVTILNALINKGIKLKINELVSYHDPCHLGRHENIYNEPREVIARLGGDIIEMKNNRQNALCCGGGGGLRANYEKISKQIAQKRVQEVNKNVTKIITPCGLCYSNLKDADERSVEFSNFVLNKLKNM